MPLTCNTLPSLSGRHSSLSHGVLCERECEWIVQVLLQDLYRAEGMHEADGDPAPERRVRAGPGVAYADDPCRHRNQFGSFERRPIASTTRSAETSSPSVVRTPVTCGIPFAVDAPVSRPTTQTPRRTGRSLSATLATPYSIAGGDP